VEQISLPFRIALVALLVVGGLWFAVLRPKPATDTATTAPGTTGLANDVAKAQGAAAASDAAAGADSTSAAPAATATPQSDANAPAASGQPNKAAKPGLAAQAVAGDPSRGVLTAVDKGKVAVVLFWNGKAADDRATRKALTAVDRHRGKVVTRAIPIADVGKYEAITRGAQVLESPTVLVIGAGGKARSITGYTQASEIDQLVGAVGGKGYEAKKAFQLTGFAKVADGTCRNFAFDVSQSSDFPSSRASLISYFDTGASKMDKAGAQLKATPAKGAQAQALKASLVAFSERDVVLARAASKDLKGSGSTAPVVSTFLAKEQAAKKPSAALAKTARVTGCQ
jgi:hypothetical protein